MSASLLVALSTLTTVLAAVPGPVPTDEPLTVHSHAFIRAGYLEIEVAAKAATFPPAETDIDLQVSGPAGVVRRARLALDPKRASAALRLEARDVPDGRLTITATAVHRQTGQKLVLQKCLDRPLRPRWLDTQEGLSRTVPAPWTALVVDGTAVKPWGRTYRFEQSLLPTELLTGNASVLAGPVRLVAQVAGKTVDWKAATVDYRERRADAVVLSGRATAGGLTLRGTTTIEYDGMLRADLELLPERGPVEVQSLLLEVPLRAQYARYLYHFPGKWGSVANSGFLPAAGWASPFKPMLWLGDEDRGLAWFCESDRNWLLSDPKLALTIDRQPATFTLRCRLIDHPVRVESPLDYTFGLQATPVKRPEKTVWDYRITHHGRYGLEREPASLGASVVYAGRGRLRADQGTFECWYRPAFDSERETPLPQRKHAENREILAIRWPGGDTMHGTNCGLYYNGHVQGPVLWSRRDGKVLLNPGVPVDWKAGDWHHLAFSWSDKVRFYIDGRLASETPNQGMIPAPPDNATITIGGGPLGESIDEMRILGVARAAVLPSGPAQADAETLLVDHFDNYGPPDAKTPGEARGLPSFGDGRFGKAFGSAPAHARTQLEALAVQGVRTICFHEHWSPYQAYPCATEENRPKLLSLVQACHAQKLQLLLYMSREMADNAPEWELYGQESLVQPRRGGYRRQPPQSDWYVCWRSPWKEFCLHHLARLLDEIGHDGWYLDGPEWPQPCTNRHHGCGYVGPDGKLHPTYDIFATRDFMKRLYVLTRQRRPQAQLNIHNSTVMTIPTLAWGTSSWSGEQLDTIKPPVRTVDVLPMDAFRTEFMGRQWGVPSEFLVYDGRPYSSRDMLAYTLLHGVLIRPGSPETLARTSALWKIYDSFPLADATMYPYWDDKGPIRCQPAGVYVTAYQRPGEGLLLFVSNLGEEPVRATLLLDLPRLGLSASLAARDALGETSVPLNGSALELPIGRWQYRVLRIRPQAAR
jgi:hypothetical protein